MDDKVVGWRLAFAHQRNVWRRALEDFRTLARDHLQAEVGAAVALGVVGFARDRWNGVPVTNDGVLQAAVWGTAGFGVVVAGLLAYARYCAPARMAADQADKQAKADAALGAALAALDARKAEAAIREQVLHALLANCLWMGKNVLGSMPPRDCQDAAREAWNKDQFLPWQDVALKASGEARGVGAYARARPRIQPQERGAGRDQMIASINAMLDELTLLTREIEQRPGFTALPTKPEPVAELFRAFVQPSRPKASSEGPQS